MGRSYTSLSGEGDLTLSQFNTRTAKHYFCRHCGVHPFIRPWIDSTRWPVNAHCLEGVDLAALKVRRFEGATWEAAARAYLERSK